MFPRRCPACHDIVVERGELICPECRQKFTLVKAPYCIKCGKKMVTSDEILCNTCKMRTVPFDEGRAVFVYDDVMRKSIYRFKYGGRKEYARFYAKEIVANLSEKIIKWRVDVIIPIPLHKSKLRKRGFNQAFLIAKEISHLTKIPVDNKLLIRTKKTEKQKNLGVLERDGNLKNAFKIRRDKVQYLSAMLIDDIYTTGATMSNATAVLKSSGFQHVYCVSLSIGIDV
ncbi:MAG: ComF family protein [Lachnospiraceae bacterium]|nr:ComF family protein [Lachnospiraceae bacterium]